MQKVRFASSLTSECTQVTPSSVLLSTTLMHALAPVASMGMTSPSGNVRSTRYRGISALRLVHSSGRAATVDDSTGALHRERSLFFAGAFPILREQAAALRRGDGGAAGIHAQFIEDCGAVVVDGLGRDEEPAADLGVGEAQRERGQDLLLARSEIEGMLAPRRPRTARHVAHAQLGEAATQACGRGSRSEAIEDLERGQERLGILRLVAGE